MSRNIRFLIAALIFAAALPGVAAELKPIVIPDGFEHDRWQTQPQDIVKEFNAFTVSFDSADDDDGDEIADVWAIPHWVAYEMQALDDVTGHPEPATWGHLKTGHFETKGIRRLTSFSGVFQEGGNDGESAQDGQGASDRGSEAAGLVESEDCSRVGDSPFDGGILRGVKTGQSGHRVGRPARR